VLVVVPAYNEARCIAAVLREIRAHLPQVSVLVVDDGSEDETSAVCDDAGVGCLSLPFNLGVGGAMRAGFLYARECGYGVVVQVDADGQHDVTYVAALVAEVDRGADVTVGSRFTGPGNYQVTASRRLAMSLVARVMSRACRVRLTDATSGFRAVGPTALDLFCTTYPTEYLGDTLQSLLVARRAGLVVREVPVRMRPRSAGRPSQGVAGSLVYLARSLFLIALGSRGRPEREWRRARGAAS
jgi:glycosyltransferase involved in cell wall biosynthesis